ncbi:hypothetical protein [Anthocerotibacter panamensis]|uniref:hypothetical protein n=1 Tax=Anthocerotibacter panamensis TaxID=2857077 RepID=UPI001C40222C|nr:hypothetical protein [Anthocerotibacter panamensis]
MPKLLVILFVLCTQAAFSQSLLEKASCPPDDISILKPQEQKYVLAVRMLAAQNVAGMREMDTRSLDYELLDLGYSFCRVFKRKLLVNTVARSIGASMTDHEMRTYIWIATLSAQQYLCPLPES